MSLLINGMNMPRYMTMKDYTLRVRQDGTAELIDRAIGKSYDVIDVPTPHGRLIDADRLIVALKNSVYANAIFHTPALTASQIEQLIENQPTVIEKESDNNGKR